MSIAQERLSNADDWHPSGEVVSAFAHIDEGVLGELKRVHPDDPYRVIHMYSVNLTSRLVKLEADPEQRRLMMDGNNAVNAIIMEGRGSEKGVADFVSRGEDIYELEKLLARKKEENYGNVSSYQLWAGLYLDLRERLFGPEKNEESIALIGQLRAQIAG